MTNKELQAIRRWISRVAKGGPDSNDMLTSKACVYVPMLLAEVERLTKAVDADAVELIAELQDEQEENGDLRAEVERLKLINNQQQTIIKEHQDAAEQYEKWITNNREKHRRNMKILKGSG